MKCICMVYGMCVFVCAVCLHMCSMGYTFVYVGGVLAQVWIPHSDTGDVFVGNE